VYVREKKWRSAVDDHVDHALRQLVGLGKHNGNLGTQSPQPLTPDRMLRRLMAKNMPINALHSLGNRFRVAEVVLLAFRIRPKPCRSLTLTASSLNSQTASAASSSERINLMMRAARRRRATRRIEKAIGVIKPKVNPRCERWMSAVILRRVNGWFASAPV
jgi:hypothetical protein